MNNNDDIKRVLESLNTFKYQQAPAESVEIDEAPTGALAAQANLAKGATLKGTFNAKTFGSLLGMDSSEASLLTSFLSKHKQGVNPTRNEILAAADVFRALVDSDPKATAQALSMLRRISVDAAPTESQSMSESIRVTKEGVEECWSDMPEQSALSGSPTDAAEMTVNISMPGKSISVTTSSADEIVNMLKLAGIDVTAGTDAELEEPAGTDATDDMPIYVGAAPSSAEEPSSAPSSAEEPSSAPSSAEEPSDDKKPLNDEEMEDEEDNMKESNRILQLSGVTEAQSAAQKAAFKAMIAKKNGGKSESDDGKKPDADGDGIPDWADKKDNSKVKEEAPASNSIYGQSVYEGQTEYSRILANAGISETKLANSPANTDFDEPMEFDKLPSSPGDGGGRKEYGANRANNQGENPMGDLEEAVQSALNEYRKFVSENIASKKK